MHLLCDIDGVHIPFPGPAGEIPDDFRTHHVTPTGYSEPVAIWLNPATGRLALDLTTRYALTPVWCTSWRADAAPLIGSLLGLPTWDHIELPRLPLTTSHPNGYLWKRDTITQLFTDRPIVWIDDDFTPADHTWADDRTATGVLTILIQPNPYLGLTAADFEATGLDEIAKWRWHARAGKCVRYGESMPDAPADMEPLTWRPSFRP